MPAMNADSAKATSLVLATLIPAAAAARSFERTASIRRPRSERRSATTPPSTRPSTTTHIVTNDPPGGRNETPKSVGAGMSAWDFEPKPDWNAGSWYTNDSITTAAAKVATARLTPRIRSAGTAATSPTTVATNAATIGPTGNQTPWVTQNLASTNAEIPPRVICINETCPMKPVSTVSDEHMIAAITALARASCQFWS